MKTWEFEITAEQYAEYRHGKSMYEITENLVPGSQLMTIYAYGVQNAYVTEKNGKHYVVVRTYGSCD